MGDENKYKIRREKLRSLGYYVYVYMDPRKPGDYIYGELKLTHKPFYVGKGYGYRINEHMYKTHLKRNNHKNNKIKKILSEGLEPIRVKVYEGLTEKESLQKEIELINSIGFVNLTNVTHGGEGTSGYEQSDETKNKIGNKNKGRKHSEETKKRISEKLKGREITQEWKDKISEGSKGKPKKPFTDEHRKKISESKLGGVPWNKGCIGCQKPHNKGKSLSEEHRKKQSEIKLGKKRGKMSEETKKKISESLKKRNKKSKK